MMAISRAYGTWRVHGTRGIATLAKSLIEAARGQRTRLREAVPYLVKDPKEWPQV